MKIMSYNILSGGFESYKDESPVPQRLDKLRAAVAEINADVVSFIDTYRWDEVMSEDKLKALFDYPHVYSVQLEDGRLALKGHDNGITVMCKNEVIFEKIRLHNRNAIKSRIKNGDSDIELFSTYLDDESEEVRKKEVGELFKITDINKPTIIMGDLNTIDKGDLSQSTSDLMHLLANFPKLKQMEPALREMEKGEVTALIKSMGLVDADEYNKRRTIPSKLFVVPTFNPILRLDYAFYNKLVHKVNFEVLRGPMFDYLSDHYPILLEIE